MFLSKHFLRLCALSLGIPRAHRGAIQSHTMGGRQGLCCGVAGVGLGDSGVLSDCVELYVVSQAKQTREEDGFLENMIEHDCRDATSRQLPRMRSATANFFSSPFWFDLQF
jgi:hypothetical protein